MVIQDQEVQAGSGFSGTERKYGVLSIFKRHCGEEIYEVCAFWIEPMRLSGATQREIAWLLKHPSWPIEEEWILN